MTARLAGLLRAPELPDPERRRMASVLHPMALWIAGGMGVNAALSAVPGMVPAPDLAWTLQALILGIVVSVLAMLRAGRVHLAAAVFSAALWLVITGITFALGGVGGPHVANYVLVTVLAGFLWGRRGVVAFAALSIAAATGMLALELAGLQPEPLAPYTPTYGWLVLVTAVVITAALIHRSVRATDRALSEARRSEFAALEASRAEEAGRRRLETHAREQAALAELSQVALVEELPQVLMEEAARVVGSTLGVPYVSLLERSADGREVRMCAGLGWPASLYGRLRLPVDRAMPALHTLRTREPVVVEDLARERRFPASESLHALGVVSGLTVAIPGETEAFGVIGVHDTERRRFAEADVRFLEAVANLVALAVRRSRAQSRLREREQELLHAQKMEAVGRFAGGIAHDFNNLLTGVSGYTDFLLDALEPDHPGRADAEEIARVAAQASSLTRQILAFSRRQVLQPQVLDLNAAIRRTESMLRRLMGEDVELVTGLAPDLAPVRADPGQVEQVLLNLAVNARDAMPRGGELRITTHDDADAGTVVLEVSDTGVGMEAEVQARAFDPFFTTKDRFKGTGLGLSTVYGIVTQSEGSIAVESHPGRGSCFRIALPACEGRVAPPVPPARVRPGRGCETVLVAEDESTVRHLMLRSLRDAGYAVIEAGDGAEALARAEAHAAPIHVLVTDVIMPGLGGGELAERLKDFHPETRVLYVSGYADDAIAHQGVLAADAAFLAKPFSVSQLVRKVRDVLDAPGGRAVA